MKKKVVLAVLAAAIMALSLTNVFALDYEVPENATTVTARFFVTEDEQDNEFSMVSEDGELTIDITDDVIIYFEDYVPLGDEDEGMTQMVREVLFGRTLAEVLEGRNMRVILNDEGELISVKVLFEIAVHLPQDIEGEDLTDGDYVAIVDLPDLVDLSGVGAVDLGDDYVSIVTLPGEIDLDGDYEDIVTLPGEIDFAGWEIDSDFTLNGEVVVNGVIIEDAPTPFIDGNVVMVPLRVVAEALELDVSWNEYLQSIQIGGGRHIWIGRTEVHVGRMAPIELSAAPIISNNLTFVPIDFFRFVLGQTVYVFEGQVVIETYSDMR